MKKITIVLLFLFGAFSVGLAQTAATTQPATATSSADKAAIAAQKKADKEAKKLAKQQQKDALEAQKNANKEANAAQSTHLTKNGTPDKRFKANKQPQAQAQAQTPAPVQAQPQPQVVTKTQPSQPAVVAKQSTATRTQVSHPANSTDKVIGTDSKGRTIYEGPRGGHYYVDKNGNKEYVKKQ